MQGSNGSNWGTIKSWTCKAFDYNVSLFPKIKKIIPMFIEERRFEFWMNRLVAHFETVNRKIDRLSNTENKIIDEVLLDNQDLCLLLKVSNRTLQRFRSSGKLPYKRIGKKTYYLESDVHEFIQRGFSKTY
jgi:hypothetical protein